MKIIKVYNCQDCPLMEEKLYMTPAFFKPFCKDLQRNIPVSTWLKKKIWGKCKLEDKK